MSVPVGTLTLYNGLPSTSPSQSPSASLSPSASVSPSISPSSSVSPSSSASRSASPSSSASRSVSRSSSSSPSPSSGGDSFILRDSTNTGIVGAGVSEASLVDTAGTTYTSANNGQTISLRRFTSQVTISSASNMIFDRCVFESSVYTGRGIVVTGGTNNIVQDCTIRRTSGSSWHGIYFNGGSGMQILRTHIQGLSENALTVDSHTDLLVDQCYFHGIATPSNPGGHLDCIEVYGGTNLTFQRSTFMMGNEPTAPFNIAPFGGKVCNGVNLYDNYIDGGQGHFTIDGQTSGGGFTELTCIKNVRILRNRFGGHGGGGVWSPYLVGLKNYESRAAVDTEAQLQANQTDILFPDGAADPDRNIWFYCVNNPFGLSNLSPDRTNQTCLASQWIG